MLLMGWFSLAEKYESRFAQMYKQLVGEIERRLQGMRRTLSFYGSTRTYHKVLAVHGLEGLGQELHDLSLEGRWGDMAETVTADHIRELAQTCTYDELPDFLAQHREYATVTSFPTATDRPGQEERARDLVSRIHATSLS